MYSRIVGTGKYLPERILTNAELERMVDTTDEWIRSRTGIEFRHIAADNEFTSDLASKAGLEALQSAGLHDERFFLYSEEPDLGLRVKQAGWDVRHLPVMTVVHHAGREGTDPKLKSQDAYSRLQFAQKHFSSPHRAAYRGALALGNLLRAVAPGHARGEQRRAARAALRVLAGLDGPPFGAPPAQALVPLDAAEVR